MMMVVVVVVVVMVVVMMRYTDLFYGFQTDLKYGNFLDQDQPITIQPCHHCGI